MKYDVISRRIKNKRLRSIWLEVRKLKRYEGLSDIILLFEIINTLLSNGYNYCKYEGYSAFKEVNEDEYEEEDRGRLLRKITIYAQERSVLRSK